jgi:Tfp pilus assembly protein PilX
MMHGTLRPSPGALGAGRAARPVTATRRRGAVAVIAMLYMLLLTTLALAMYAVANVNVQTSQNFNDLTKAHAAAESALRWMDSRFQAINRPKTDKGTISATVANTLWPSFRDAVKADLETVRGANGSLLKVTYSVGGEKLTTSGLCLDSTGGATCDIEVRQLSAADGVRYDGSKIDQRWVRVTCTGRYFRAARAVSMDFLMDKKVKFGVMGKVSIQVGRNTIIDGAIGMSTTNKWPPVYVLSDFNHFHAGLKTKVDAFNVYLEGVGSVDGRVVKNHNGYDNRISINNSDEFKLATAAGYKDLNGDAFIDEYDLFFDVFDTNRDKMVTKAEFTNPATGKLYDEQLFALIDRLGPPLLNEDVNKNGIFDAGEMDLNGDSIPQWEDKRPGYDDGVLDYRDPVYAKVKGGITLATTVDAWNAQLAGSGNNVYDMIRGPITTLDPAAPAVKFGATTQEVFDLSPANFEQVTLNYKAKAGTVAVAGTAAAFDGKLITSSQANAGTVTERTPYGSTSWQATFARPKFTGVTFTNCTIKLGTNALFDGCTFKGTTYIEMTRNIVKPGTTTVTTNKDDGMAWAKRMISGTFSNTTTLTSANSSGFKEGNNIRFNDCTFEGPLIGAYSTAYTHFANSWEFTGATYFNNKVDPSATIVAPNTNMEMGSFTNPAAAPSTLLGIVVAGNIDIRGSTFIDGSLLVTGDGAGNTTLAYFGNNDGETNPTAMPEGGYGKLYVRYNPFRAMPDGINIPIDMVAQPDTYREGKR